MPAAPECVRNLEIEIPAGEVEREIGRIAQGLQRRARIAGFRPGKAPLSLVRQRYQGQIREELMNTLLPAHLRAAFEREQLEPVSTPTIEDLHFSSGEPIRFKASFEVLPPIELGDYKSLRVELPQATVTDADVEEEVAALRERYATYEPVAPEGTEPPPAADGMTARFSATRRRPVPAAEGEQPEPVSEVSEDELDIEIGGSNTLPEFSQGLRGMRPGESRDVDIPYPADYGRRELAGQTVAYTIKLNRLERKHLPELTEEFLKEKTGTSSPEELRQRIREARLHELEHQYRHEAEEKLIEQLADQHEFPVPNSLVEKQIEVILERRLRSLAYQGVDPRSLKLDWEKLRAANEPIARRQVKGALLLERIGDRENIPVPDDEVEAEVAEIARRANQTIEETRRRLTENGALDRIKSRARNERVLAFLLAIATGKGPSQEQAKS